MVTVRPSFDLPIMIKILAYLTILIAVSDAQVGHSTQDGDERLDRVAVHHRPILFEVFICEATFVDNSVDKQL